MINENDRNSHSFNDIKKRFDYLIEQSSFQMDSKILENYSLFCTALKCSPEKKLFPKSMPFFINNASDCRNCFYGFQLDTYAFGCTHECIYCWAKTELTKINLWNSPSPTPIDLTILWEAFYLVFEKGQKHPLKDILLKKIPLRIGSMSDPFLKMESKFKITKNLLMLLKYYDYPYLILTRSDMVSDDEYIELYNNKNTAIQFSIPSLNEELISILEPGAPSAQKRLESLKKISDKKIWTTVRINPLFPNYPDKTYTLDIKKDGLPFLDFYSHELLYEIAKTNCRSILVGFVHLDTQATRNISDHLNINLNQFLSEDFKNEGHFKYTSNEIKHIYQNIKNECIKLNLQFSTCYLGLDEKFFWNDRASWADQDDCCNLKNNVPSFENNALSLPTYKWKQKKASWRDILLSFEYKLNFYLMKKISKSRDETR